jgi:hypothetical protein
VPAAEEQLDKLHDAPPDSPQRSSRYRRRPRVLMQSQLCETDGGCVKKLSAAIGHFDETKRGHGRGICGPMGECEGQLSRPY